MKKYMHVTIEGRVQGVFFRHYAKRSAIENNITGYVRNCADGTVFIECSGEENDIEKFLTFCHKGSPAARVTKVCIEETTQQRVFDTFEIY